MLAPQKESIFGCFCRLWLLSWRRARIFARSCSLLSKYLPISWKQRKEQSHAQCHVTHRIRTFDKISEHVKVAKPVDIAVPELAVTTSKYGKAFFTLLKSIFSDEGGKLQSKEIFIFKQKTLGQQILCCGQILQAVVWKTGFAVRKYMSLGNVVGFCTFYATMHRRSSRSSREAASLAFAQLFSGRYFVKSMLGMPLR